MQALLNRFRIIEAILVRDLMVKYGRNNIGFMWAVIEPMILTTGVMVLWRIMRPDYEHGIALMAIVLTGYTMLTLWRHLNACGIHLFQRSTSLLYHRQISMDDVLLTRIFLEFLAATIALTTIYGILFLLEMVEPPKDWGLFILAWFLMGWLAGCVGAIIASTTAIYEGGDRFVQPFNYLMIPISGVFFMADWLSPTAREIMLLNPVFNCNEMFRGGVFGDDVTTYYDVGYIVSWCVGLSFLAIFVMRKAKREFDPDNW